ncbi:hypothetical protein [Streptomyces sp. NBC_01262]|jgi:hypothetical protein|uniref:hypothetical protein n=1 Tax=Streptomyces sp. NBC_01262 TaxID=2903803 RepID=UPI002E377138|nr:hypothetical protein [Streptomyces sp. NBC_01262]
MNRFKLFLVTAASVLAIGLGLPNTAMAADPPKPSANTAQVSGDESSAYETGGWVYVAPGGYGSAYVYCPTGRTPTGGGGQSYGTVRAFLTDSYAVDPRGWFAQFYNAGTTGVSVRAYARCA